MRVVESIQYMGPGITKPIASKYSISRINSKQKVTLPTSFHSQYRILELRHHAIPWVASCMVAQYIE